MFVMTTQPPLMLGSGHARVRVQSAHHSQGPGKVAFHEGPWAPAEAAHSWTWAKLGAIAVSFTFLRPSILQALYFHT